jgi:hypothetical protein
VRPGKLQAAAASSSKAKAKAKGPAPRLSTSKGKSSLNPTPLRARKEPLHPCVGKPGPKPYDWRPIFLKSIRYSVGVVQPAAEAAAICRDTAYEERKKNPDFAKDWETAVQAGVDDLEQHALELARGRMVKGIYYEGERVGQEPVQFERTLHKALAKHRPEWGDRTELTGKGGKPLIPGNLRSFDLEAMSDEELDALRTKLDDAAATAH